MRTAVVLCLLLVPLVLAGDYAKMWAELEEQVKQKLSEQEDSKKDDDSKGWEDQKGWGENKGWGEHEGWGDKKKAQDVVKDDSEEKDVDAKGWGEQKGWGEHKGWGDKKKVQEVAKDDSEEKDDDLAESWGRKEHKGWGEHRSKGWGDEKKKESKDEEKDSEKEEFKRWEEHRSRGWGERKGRKSHDVDKDDEEEKENVKEKYIEFKEYLKRKALKVEEEKEAKAEIYRQMERVQLKKFLAEKLQQITKEFQKQKLEYVFQATSQFLSLCQGDSNARDILERLDNGQFAVPEQLAQINNDTESPFDLGDEFDLDFNSSFARILNDPVAKEAKIRKLVNLEPEERVKVVLHGYVQILCSSAQHFTNFVELVESNVIACKRGLIQCDDNPAGGP